MRIRPPSSTVHTSTSHVLIASRHLFHPSIAFFHIACLHRTYVCIIIFYPPSRSLIILISRPFGFLPPLITCIHMRLTVCSYPVYRHSFMHDSMYGGFRMMNTHPRKTYCIVHTWEKKNLLHAILLSSLSERYEVPITHMSDHV